MNIHLEKKLLSSHLWLIGLGIITVIAVFTRILSWEHFAWTKGGVPFSDSQALDMLALNVLDGIGFRDRIAYWLYEAFRMPFFSVTLASIYAVFGYDYIPARIIFLGISVATCLGVAGIGRILFNRTVGFSTGLFCSLYYPLIFYSHALMTETLSIFLFVLGVYMFLRSLHERYWGFSIGSGIAVGLAIMTRYAFIATLPILLVYLLSNSFSWGRKIRLGTIWIAFIMVSFSPWIIRNALVFDTFFPSASGGTRMIWTGSNPKFGGTTFTGEAWRDILWVDQDATEIERTKRIQKEALEFIKQNPSWYFGKLVWRANHHLNIPNVNDLKNGKNFFVLWTNVSIITAAWLGTIGIFLALFKRTRSGLLLGGIFVSLLALHSIAGEAVRYRLASEWIWLIGAAYTVFCLSQLFTHPFFDIDKNNNQPILKSAFDNIIIKWLVPILLILPFIILSIRIPINRELKYQEKLPVLQRSVENVLHSNGLIKEFRSQGSILHDITYYKMLALTQPPNKVISPHDIVIFSGELSHFVCNPNREIKNFSLKVNKVGLYVGDAHLKCIVEKKISLILTERIKKLKRTQGIIVGTISNTGPLGDIVISVSDIIINGISLKSE